MTDYYEDEARRDLFDERWAPRSELNEALDKLDELQALNTEVTDQLAAITAALANVETLETLVEGTLFSLRKGADDLQRAAEILLETAELGE